jgi:hypothetical protein
MTHGVANGAAMLAGWDDLRRELDAWEGAGERATVWWRDDDAVAATPMLERLLAAAQGTPIALAVVPAQAERGLVAALAAAPHASVLQHGWSHADHAPVGAKKAELGDDRPPRAILDELIAGRRILSDLFGARFIPVLVPPWNRIAATLVPELAGSFFTGLSVFGPRTASRRAGLACANVHVDIMEWRAGAFIGIERALGLVVAHLAARRQGRADRDEPTGVMSHHLVHGASAESFLERLFAELQGHRAARVLSADEVFR